MICAVGAKVRWAKTAEEINFMELEGSILLSLEEKEQYIKELDMDKSHPFQKLFALFLAIVAFSSFRILPDMTGLEPLRRAGGILFGIFLFLLFAGGSAAVFHVSNEDKKEYRYLKTCDIYRARVYFYDKRRDEDGNFIRISDENGRLIEGYYGIGAKQYKSAESIAWYAYYYRQKDGSLKIRVREGILQESNRI